MAVCTAQMGTLKDALIAFRMKNGMGKKAAASDAAMTVDDYVAAIDHLISIANEENVGIGTDFTQDQADDFFEPVLVG